MNRKLLEILNFEGLMKNEWVVSVWRPMLWVFVVIIVIFVIYLIFLFIAKVRK